MIKSNVAGNVSAGFVVRSYRSVYIKWESCQRCTLLRGLFIKKGKKGKERGRPDMETVFVPIAKRFYELNFYSLRGKIKIFQLLEFNQRSNFHSSISSFVAASIWRFRGFEARSMNDSKTIQSKAGRSIHARIKNRRTIELIVARYSTDSKISLFNY